jgi:class 3 adenylate cyclase
MIDSDVSAYSAIDGARARGDMFALFDLTRAALVTDPDDPKLRYLQTLALARLGEPNAALALYSRNRVAEIGTEDALALQGRILKDMAVLASGEQRSRLFQQASQAYRAANTLNDGYFSAINAATTALLAGNHIEASRLATAVLRRSEIAQPTEYYAAATAGEAMLLGHRVEDAITQLVDACRFGNADMGARASTMRQLLLIVDAIELEGSDRGRLLEAVRPPPVLFYCGHTFTAGWADEVQLIEKIDDVLEASRVHIAYGALACGSDILVAEAVLKRGGEIHIILPFDEEDFIATSVAPGGAEWRARYDHLRARATSITLATRMRFIGDDQQFSYGSRLAMGLARLRAQTMHTEALQLALWDGASPQASAGTAANVAVWAQRGGKMEIISAGADRPRLPRLASVEAYDGPPRYLRAILFADFSGFSRLSESSLPSFLNQVMGRAGAVLDQHREGVLCRNSWGDAIFAVIDTPELAATIAVAIQRELNRNFLIAAGLPEEGGMRISLHHGPIYEDFDPVRLERTYYGTEVTLAARIEPMVPIGGIYVTQSFAAIVDPAAIEQFGLEYVGAIDLAKGFGSRLIYRLADRRPAGPNHLDEARSDEGIAAGI